MDAVPRVAGDVFGEHGPVDTSDLVRKALVDNALILSRLPREVDALARRLLHGDLRTRVSLLSEPEDVRVARGMVNRIVMALVGSALALSSALLLSATSAPTLHGVRVINLLGGIGLVFSLLLLLRLVVQTLREHD
jgi:ubiquinone biosynthesis protein